MKISRENGVVLINPRSTHLGEIATKCFPPMGLLSLATTLDTNGVKVSLIDANALGLTDTDLVCRIAQQRPILVGLPVYAETMNAALRTIDCIRAAIPQVAIVVGGPQASACPDWVLEELPKVDYLLEGEAEDSLLQLVRAVESAADVSSIPGLHLPKTSVFKPRSPINLDNFPISDRGLLKEAYDSERYYALLVPHRKLDCLVTSRGCPFQCHFCYNSSPKMRFRSIDSCLQEIGLMRDAGVRNIEILDDNFTAVESRALDFLERIRKESFGISFRIKSRADSISDRLVSAAKKASVYQISLGAESGSPRLLRAMNKRISPVQIANAVRIVKSFGIKCHASFIVGYPGETLESLEDSTDLIRHIKPTTVGLAILIPYPGTFVYEEARSKGVLEGKWSARSTRVPWVRLPWTKSYDDLVTAKKKMLRKIYLRPHYVLNYGQEVIGHANGLLARYAIQELLKVSRGSLDER